MAIPESTNANASGCSRRWRPKHITANPPTMAMNPLTSFQVWWLFSTIDPRRIRIVLSSGLMNAIAVKPSESSGGCMSSPRHPQGRRWFIDRDRRDCKSKRLSNLTVEARVLVLVALTLGTSGHSPCGKTSSDAASSETASTSATKASSAWICSRRGRFRWRHTFPLKRFR